MFALKRSQQLDGRNIVPRTVFPCTGKTTGAKEAKICLRNDQWGFRDGGGKGAERFLASDFLLHAVSGTGPG